MMKQHYHISDSGRDDKYGYWLFLFVLLALSLFMVCWFGPVSEYAGHDYYFNIRRFDVLTNALRLHTYPIYIDYQALEGYGYFTKGFYPDLIILPFAALGLFVGTVAAYNVMIFLMTFLCGYFTYKAVNTIFHNNFVASASSILYTFSVYHLFDWYNRAALGESLSFTFLPIVFLGLYQIIKGDYKKWYILTIGYSLLIYTHLLSSFLTLIVLVLISILNCRRLLKEPRRIVFLVLAALVSIPLTASYIFTMLEQMASNTFYYSVNENITGQTKLTLSHIGWGVMSGIVYPKSENMAGIGLLIILLILLRVFVKEKSRLLKMADFCVLIGVILLLAASSLFPWGRLPLGFIQFPWRLYEFIVFFFAVGGSYYLACVLKTKRQLTIASVVIIAFTMLVFVTSDNNYKHWQSLAKSEAPEWFTGVASVENEYYLGGLEYLPTKVPSYNYIHQRRSDSIRFEHEDTASFSDISRDKGVFSVNITSPQTTTVELPLVFYKGYKAILNGEILSIGESKNGLIEFTINQSGKIEVFYTWTLVQQISWYITLFSIFILIIYISFFRRKGGKQRNLTI